MMSRIKSPQLYRLSYRPFRLASAFAASLVSLVYPSGSHKGKSHSESASSGRVDTDVLEPLRAWTTGGGR